MSKESIDKPNKLIRPSEDKRVHAERRRMTTDHQSVTIEKKKEKKVNRRLNTPEDYLGLHISRFMFYLFYVSEIRRDRKRLIRWELVTKTLSSRTGDTV